MSQVVPDLLHKTLIAAKAPLGTYFDVKPHEVEFQAETQEAAAKLRECFPGVLWHKRYNENVAWWEYTGTYNGINLRIYAVREAPATCKAIVETRVFEERIPTAWETRQVEKNVIVGWDCEGDKDDGGSLP